MISTNKTALIVVRLSALGLPVLAGFGICGLIIFHCESVNSLNIKTESMLLFMDLLIIRICLNGWFWDQLHVPTDKTEGTGGSNYGFQEPIIEDPERATRYLYNLVRGFALGQGRNYIIEDDVSIIKQIVMSSAAKERVELLKLLIKNNGEVIVTQLMDARGVTRTTTLKTMKLLEILGLVDEIKVPGSTKDISAIRLKDHFRWTLENK